MGKVVAAAVVVAVVGVAAAALLGSDGSGHSRAGHSRFVPFPPATFVGVGHSPKWAQKIVRLSTRDFYYRWRGQLLHPHLLFAAYKKGLKADRLAVVFDREVACGPCSYPDGGRPLRGRILGASYAFDSHRLLGFTFGGAGFTDQQAVNSVLHRMRLSPQP